MIGLSTQGLNLAPLFTRRIVYLLHYADIQLYKLMSWKPRNYWFFDVKTSNFMNCKMVVEIDKRSWDVHMLVKHEIWTNISETLFNKFISTILTNFKVRQTAVDNFGRNRSIKNEWPPLFIFTQTHFNAFANRVDSDQASLVRAAWWGSTLFAQIEIWYICIYTSDVTIIFLLHVQKWKFIYTLSNESASLFRCA